MIKLDKGKVVIFNERKYKVSEIGDNTISLIDSEGNIEKLKNDQIEERVDSGIPSLTAIDEDRLKIAKSRYLLIKPLLGKKGSRREIEKLSETESVSVATIYRWIKSYNKDGLMSSLAPKERPGGKGKSRLKDSIDEIVDHCIKHEYLNKQKRSIQSVYFQIKVTCKEKGLNAPHYNTVRRRIIALSEREIVKHRLGRSSARKRFDPKTKHFPDSNFPLSSVQIDHTPLDIIVVDQEHREPLGRPWITLAIDTYSRMVVGFYVGLERPNSMSVGLCLAHAMLPKEEYLARFDIYEKWPCSGRIRTIHVDNAKEFRSKVLDEAALEYGIDLNWRPAKKPEYGGMIERLLGTFLSELHQLKGTTFESVSKRGEYDSEKEAVFTFEELEGYLALYIVNFYHQKFHSGIQRSPLSKWQEGVYGTDDEIGVGIGLGHQDSRKVVLDLTPYEERTIQEYGVQIDGIHYYGEILRKWINSVDIKSGKLRAKQKFKFKRDPRNISKVYFLDPELKEYFEIPYRDSSRPVLTIWELRQIRLELRKQGQEEIDENLIFETYRKLRELESTAFKETKRSRREKEIKRNQEHRQDIIRPSKKKASKNMNFNDDLFQDLGTFEDIDDGSSE